MRKGLHNGYSRTGPDRTTCPSGLIASDYARFWEKVRQSPSGCWEWTANRAGGGRQRLYGQFTANVDGRRVALYAHRLSWQMAHGAIPAGHYVCHACDNTICVNPAHLFLGSQFDNMRDASAKGRLAIPRKRNRATRTQAVAKYLAGGVTAAALAAEYGVAMMTILRWVKAHIGNVDLRRRSA
jgi:hypothetical protein